MIATQIVECFQKRSDVIEEGFLVFGSLCVMFQGEMMQYVEKFYDYIDFGLNSGSANVIRLACCLIGDIQAYGCGDGLVNYIDKFIPILIKHLKSGDVDRSVKVRCISAIAETYLIGGAKFDRYIEQTMQMLNSAANRCVKLDADNADNDVFDYVLSLQNVLIEAYTIIIQDIDNKDQTIQRAVGEHLGHIIDFLLSAADQVYKPSAVSSLI